MAAEQCVAAGEYIAGLKPDIVLLTTPHGIALSKSYTVYLNSEAAGNLLVGDLDLKERFKMNTTLGMALAKHLQNSREYDFATIDQVGSMGKARTHLSISPAAKFFWCHSARIEMGGTDTTCLHPREDDVQESTDRRLPTLGQSPTLSSKNRRRCDPWLKPVSTCVLTRFFSALMH